MTEDEHHARAMLMGAIYMPSRGWYSFMRDEKGAFKYPIHRLDCITLEPISSQEHERRVKAPKELGEPWYPHD
ncbi:hypothetical protein EVB41_070 [Rhizobium phage RHph_TM3_14A]|nr:hypothetical protein EVB29_070 [Rhizobium phage RHph_TM27A]QIG66990.1 hypothetical protein EVB30_070 [Rhizobium phage RHph_TM27B]QIG67079.1 hypothetical protein EVB31_069 [Rhizobium phage RHph_TM29]QIG67535.1 hypothetical protein EVB41_070 [Rhizobium phage RHph_TM3_14A]